MEGTTHLQLPTPPPIHAISSHDITAVEKAIPKQSQMGGKISDKQ